MQQHTEMSTLKRSLPVGAAAASSDGALSSACQLPNTPSPSLTGPNATTPNAGRWTRAEHEVFLRGLEKHGKEWKQIAEMIKTRTVVQIRTHAQKYFQKVAKHTGGPVMSTSKKDDVVRPPKRLKRKTEKAKAAESQAAAASAHASGVIHIGATSAGRGLAGSVKPKSESQVPPRLEVRPRGGSLTGSMDRGTARTVYSAGGGVTPRTRAAATILLQPRLQHRLSQGQPTPKTRQAATWYASEEAKASAVLANGDASPWKAGEG